MESQVRKKNIPNEGQEPQYYVEDHHRSYQKKKWEEVQKILDEPAEEERKALKRFMKNLKAYIKSESKAFPSEIYTDVLKHAGIKSAALCIICALDWNGRPTRCILLLGTMRKTAVGEDKSKTRSISSGYAFVEGRNV